MVDSPKTPKADETSSPKTPKADETSRQKFVRLAGLRVGNAIEATRKVALLGNKSQYEYGNEDIAKIEQALYEAVEHAIVVLRSGRPSSSTFQL